MRCGKSLSKTRSFPKWLLMFGRQCYRINKCCPRLTIRLDRRSQIPSRLGKSSFLTMLHMHPYAKPRLFNYMKISTPSQYAGVDFSHSVSTGLFHIFWQSRLCVGMGIGKYKHRRFSYKHSSPHPLASGPKGCRLRGWYLKYFEMASKSDGSCIYEGPCLQVPQSWSARYVSFRCY